MASILSRISRPILDLLLPANCEGCGKDGGFLCAGCESSLARLEPPYCSICADPKAAGLCDSCAASAPPIDGIRAPYLMGGTIAKLIHSLKYKNVRAAAPELAKLLSPYLISQPIPCDVIVPVPLHNRRERDRGYNQSELLARELSKLISVPMDTSALKRIRNTSPQVDMKSPEERQHNIEGAFACEFDFGGRRILLIDDVATTGSTMFACSKALKSANAGVVWGLALARQP